MKVPLKVDNPITSRINFVRMPYKGWMRNDSSFTQK